MNYGSRRVISVRDTERPDATTRTDASSSRRSTYTRPSSTRSSSSYNSNVHPNRSTNSGTYSRSTSRSSSTYTRGVILPVAEVVVAVLVRQVVEVATAEVAVVEDKKIVN